jgi:peroxiredoxin
MKFFLKHTVLLILISTAIIGGLKAQPFQLKVTLDGLKDTNVYLAHYYGSKILRIDSVKLDSKGTGVFKNKEERIKGIYVIYLNKDSYFDFMLGADQQFSINTSFAPQSKRVYSGAVETEQFQVYQEFLSAQRTKQQAMQKEYELHKNNADSAKTISAEMDQLNAQVEAYWTTKSAEYPNTYFADFLRSMIFPRPQPFVAPEGCKNPDSLKWVNNYIFTVNHYWDNFNFAEPGLIRSPLIDGRIDGFFKNNILQYPDSFLRPTFALIEKAKANEEMYKYISLHRLNDAITSEIMGMDKVFVAIAERYFLNKKVNWLDSTALAKIKDKVLKSKPNMIGNLAPELKLPDSDGNIFSLRQVNAKYTILLFWEPGCSHCKKTVPQIDKELYQPLKDKGIEIYAVCTQNKKEEWMKFIAENKLYDWTNVWDPSNTSNYHFLYDIYSTPVIYILDAKKKIVAKRLEVESAFKFLKQMLEQK